MIRVHPVLYMLAASLGLWAAAAVIVAWMRWS